MGVGAPSGTVTFLFTDIEGSTGLWQKDESAMRALWSATTRSSDRRSAVGAATCSPPVETGSAWRSPELVTQWAAAVDAQSSWWKNRGRRAR